MKAGKETIKHINKQIILNIFRSMDEVTKADIVGLTDLSPATVSSLTEQLVKDGFVKECYYAASKGGRKPMVYSLNEELVNLLEVEIYKKGIHIGIVNCKGKVIWDRYFKENIYSQEVLESVLEASLKSVFREKQISRDITIIAYSIPGVISYENKSIIYSAPLSTQNFNLQLFSNKIFKREMKVYTFKDTDALILGEYFLSGKNNSNLLYFLCNDGVGMSVISKGVLLRMDGCGLEIGHTSINIDGGLCKCGSKGCVGTYLGEQPTMNEYVYKYRKQHPGEKISSENLCYEDIIDRAILKRDLVAAETIKNQISILSSVLVNVINLFHPDVIVIGGPLAKYPNINNIVENRIKGAAIKPFTDKLSVRVTTLEICASLYGMAQYILDKEVFTGVSI